MLSRLQAAALRMGRDEFSAAHPEPVLVKRPGQAQFADVDPIGYETNVMRRSLDPTFAASWQFYPVRKAPENPYANRISIGRAKNCDIVVRVSALSKLHAHITFGEPTGYLITDNDSSNGTELDRVHLQPRTPIPLHFGSSLVLAGRVTLEFVTADEAYTLLRTLEAG